MSKLDSSANITVTIIVPVYDVEQYLSRCLDSLINQSLSNIEIICVNDASPDRSIDILRKYEEKYNNIRVIDLKENIRQGGARNRGMEIARGEYVGFVDSDDYVDATMYEKLYNKAKQSDADIVTCGYFVVDNSTGQTTSQFPENFTKQYSECQGVIDANKRKKLIFNAGSVWLKVYRTSMLKDNGINFPEKLQYEDNYFVPLAMMSAKKFDYVDQYLYRYCSNPNSTTTKRNNYKALEDRITTSAMLVDAMNSERYFKLIDFDSTIVTRMEFRLLNNTINIYLTTFDNIELSRLKQISSTLTFSNILAVDKTYFDGLSYLQLIKTKMRFFILRFCPRLFKFAVKLKHG